MNIVKDFENKVEEMVEMLGGCTEGEIVSCLIMMLTEEEYGYFGDYVDCDYEGDEDPNDLVKQKFSEYTMVDYINVFNDEDIYPAQGSSGTAHLILKNKNNELLKISYEVGSYGSPSFEYNDFSYTLKEVKPVTKTITVYE